MTRLLRGAVALALLATLAACNADGSGATVSASPTGLSDAELLALGKQVITCFRENGVPTAPDPVVENGQLEFAEGVEEQIESQYSPEVLERATQACQSLIDQIPATATGESDSADTEEEDPPSPEDVPALRQYAQCMRDNGVPDWPDPKPNGTFPKETLPLETEGKSPRIVAGFQACSQYWTKRQIPIS